MIEDVTERELSKVCGPGDRVRRVQVAKPAKVVSPSLRETLDRWSRADQTLGYTSNMLAYGFGYTQSREHTNLIRLIKGGWLRVYQVNAAPPTGSNASKASPFADRYFMVCAPGTII